MAFTTWLREPPGLKTWLLSGSWEGLGTSFPASPLVFTLSLVADVDVLCCKVQAELLSAQKPPDFLAPPSA